MDRKYKITCPEQYDRLISAELPNKKKYPVLYKMVTKHMMHGPCGVLNRDCPCTKGRDSCKNRYPRPFCDVTVQGKDSYPVYRRREDGRKEKVRGHELDNRWVVPYNPYLLRLFNCHINVEACGSIKAVKYLFKYIYKGHDRASVAVREADKEDSEGNVDEIKQYRDARVIGTLLFCPYSYIFQTCTWCHFIGARGFDKCLIVQVLTSQCLQRTSRRTGQMKQLEVYCIGIFLSSIRGKHRAKFGKRGYVVIHYDRLEESWLLIQPRGSVTILGFS
jgi:hypothetical protein